MGTILNYFAGNVQRFMRFFILFCYIKTTT